MYCAAVTRVNAVRAQSQGIEYESWAELSGDTADCEWKLENGKQVGRCTWLRGCALDLMHKYKVPGIVPGSLSVSINERELEKDRIRYFEDINNRSLGFTEDACPKKNDKVTVRYAPRWSTK